MKKKIYVPMIIFLFHLIICTFLSFDWSFLKGMYMGFTSTFLILWGLTLPIVIACITIGDAIIKAKRKEKLGILETITTVISGIILIIYSASASGLIKKLSLDGIYVFVFIGVFFILGSWCYKKIRKK